MSGYLAPMQVDALLRPINKNRVSVRDGNSYVQAYDVRRALISMFGFARWSADVVEATLLYEDVQEDQGRRKVSVGYMVRLRLTVCAPDGTVLATYTEAAAGDATNFPINKRGDAHDFAVKKAESQALKRCATNLGDTGGLSLYNGGSTDPLVRFVLGPDPARLGDDGRTVTRPKADEKPHSNDDHITTALAPETPAEPDPSPVEEQPAPQEMAERALGTRSKVQLTRLLVEAAKAGVVGAMVPDGDGGACTLETLIQRRIKAAA